MTAMGRAASVSEQMDNEQSTAYSSHSEFQNLVVMN
jgi:hypothetical protein